MKKHTHTITVQSVSAQPPEYVKALRRIRRAIKLANAIGIEIGMIRDADDPLKKATDKLRGDLFWTENALK